MSEQAKKDIGEYHNGIANLRAAKRVTADRYAISESRLTPIPEEGEDANDGHPENIDPKGTDTPEPAKAEAPSQEPSTSNDELETLKKRMSDKDRYITQLQEELKTREGPEEVKLPKTDDELNAWLKKNPEQADLLITLIGKQNQKLADEFNETKQQLQAMQKKTRNEVLFQDVLKIHPDAGQIKASEDFKQWFAAQTRGVQALIESDESSEIARGIALYKSDKGIGKKSNSGKQASDADLVSTRSTPNIPKEEKIWKASDLQKLTNAQYQKYRDEIAKAKREGRYDPDN